MANDGCCGLKALQALPDLSRHQYLPWDWFEIPWGALVLFSADPPVAGLRQRKVQLWNGAQQPHQKCLLEGELEGQGKDFQQLAAQQLFEPELTLVTWWDFSSLNLSSCSLHWGRRLVSWASCGEEFQSLTKWCAMLILCSAFTCCLLVHLMSLCTLGKRENNFPLHVAQHCKSLLPLLRCLFSTLLHAWLLGYFLCRGSGTQ